MTTKKRPLTPTERKRLQRQRDRASGYVETTFKVPFDQISRVRAFVASLPAPEVSDPDQLSLLAYLDRQLSGDE